MDAIAGLGLGRRQLPGLTDLFPIPTFPPLFPRPSSTTATSTTNTSQSSLTTRTSENTASTATTTSVTSQTTSLTETSTTTSTTASETETTSGGSLLILPLVPATDTPLTTTSTTFVQTSTFTPGSSRETGTSTITPAPTGFLQNKVLSGVVFSIVGVVGLILFIVITTWALRKRNQRKTLEAAISFDPANAGYRDAYDRDPEKLTLQRSASVRSNEGYGRDQWVSVTGPSAYVVQPPGQAYVTQQLGRNPSRYLPPSQAYRQPDTSVGYPY